MNKLLILIITLVNSICFAWGELGHEAVSEIAENILLEDAHTMGAIRSILGVEPLALAAVWPDKVRDDERFKPFSPYHYVTIYKNRKNNDPKSLLVALKKFPQIVLSEDSTQQEKSIALRYIIHILGDLHQPLHVGNEFDRGGNLCQVIWPKNNSKPQKTYNLHKVWDTLLPTLILNNERLKNNNSRWFGYSELVDSLMQSRHFSYLLQTEKSVDIYYWLNDSIFLRENLVYPDGKINPENRLFCKSEVNQADIPVLKDGYIRRSEYIVKNQLMLGGIRLAVFLKELFKNYKFSVLSEGEILTTFDR